VPSIGTKIFGAFLAMSVIIASLGAYGYYVLRASGEIVANTYDHPMMAINFARAASVDFLEMENEALRSESADPAERVKLTRAIDDLAATLSDDLEVADERSTAFDERSVIRKIRASVKNWQVRRHAALERGEAPNLADLDQKILDHFDLLIEFNADHGFVGRREAVTHVASYEDAVVGVTVIALLLAGAITIFLARRIVSPLSSAALVADRIAAGEFETAIPQGGKDETGALLHSMRVMQESIAAQMAREKARAQSAEVRLMDAVENSGEGVVLADGDCDIAIANSEIARFFPGLDAAFAPGRSLESALSRIETRCPATGGNPPLTMLADANAPASADRQLPDGRWVHITASRTSEGGTILFFSDFTDIKASEEHFRIAKQQAEAASAAKSRFLANMSHELRTPLNAVIGFSEILSGEAFGPLGNPRYLEYSADILKSGRNLLGVINNVLDLAQTDSGSVELRKQPVDLRDLLKGLALPFKDQCAASGLAFAGPGEGAPIFVEADEGRLGQVFFNLLSNAVRFTERGGVGIALHDGQDGVAVDISDTGIGMLPEDIETALTPFAQVDGRLARRYEGAGLGLPIARALTELHGGALSVSSEPGRGTTVTVRLPRLAGNTAAQNFHSAAG